MSLTVDQIISNYKVVQPFPVIESWVDKVNNLPWREHISDADARAYLGVLASHKDKEEAAFHAGRIGSLGGSEAGTIVDGIIKGEAGNFNSMVDTYHRLMLKELPELNISAIDPRTIGNRIEEFSREAFMLWYEKKHPGIKLERVNVTQKLRDSNRIYPYKSSPDDVFKIVGTDQYVLTDYKSPMWTQRETSEFLYNSTKGIMDDYLYQINLYGYDLAQNGYQVQDMIVFQFGFEGAAGILQMIDRFDKDGNTQAATAIRESVINQIRTGIKEDNPDLIRISAHEKKANDLVVETALLAGQQFMAKYVMAGVEPYVGRLPETDPAKKTFIDALGVQYKIASEMEKRAKQEKSRLLKLAGKASGKTDLASVKVENNLNTTKLRKALEAANAPDNGWKTTEEVSTLSVRLNEDLMLEAAKLVGINVENYMSEKTSIRPARTKVVKPTMDAVAECAIAETEKAVSEARKQVSQRLGMDLVAADLAQKPEVGGRLAEIIAQNKDEEVDQRIQVLDEDMPDMI